MSFLSRLGRLRKLWGRGRSSSTGRRACRPRVEAREDRLAPAFNVTISNAVSSNLTLMDGPGVRAFSAIGAGANVDVADIKLALSAGLDVIVRTGTSGGQAGNISWTAGDLDVDGLGAARRLSLLPDVSGTGGNITVSVSVFDSVGGGDALDLVFRSGPGGAVNLTGSTLSGVGDVTVDVGVNTATLGAIVAQGSLAVTGATIHLAGNTYTSAGDQVYTGNL